MAFYVQVDENGVPFIQIGKHQLRLDLEELDDHFKERAKTELRETPENVKGALERFRKRIKDEPGLNVPLNDDEFLIKFLRPCKYYEISAFRLMQRFYKFKIKHPELGLNLTPNHVKHVFDNEVFYFLPARTPCGARIMIINAGTKWNPKVVSLNDMFRSVMVAIEIAMLEPKTQVGGVHVIINMEGLNLYHVCQFSPSSAKMILEWVQECSPIRLKAVHLIRQSIFFSMGYAIFKPFLGEKLKKRIIIHGSSKKSLIEKISPECLPLKLGGVDSVPEYPGCLLSEMLDHYQKSFEEYNTYGYVKNPEVTSS